MGLVVSSVLNVVFNQTYLLQLIGLVFICHSKASLYTQKMGGVIFTPPIYMESFSSVMRLSFTSTAKSSQVFEKYSRNLRPFASTLVGISLVRSVLCLARLGILARLSLPLKIRSLAT